LQRAQSARDLAHLSYSRIADVLKREPGLVPQQEVDEAHSRDLISDSQVAAAKSNLQVAQQRAQVARAELGRVKTLHNYTTITAPFAGVVTKRYANKGSMIQAGTTSQSQAMPVIRLSQNNLLRLTLPVPESSVSRIRVGETLDVRVPSMGAAGSTFPGRVARFSDKVQSSTRTMDTEVDVPNPQLTLIPGMYAEVTLRVQERKNALAVPLDAVERGADQVRVYVVTEGGAIHVVQIKLGLETAQRVEVLSGVEEGATVVVGRHAGLREGQRVQARYQEVGR
jgi:RND family efflux transporter MFP subunit